MHIEKFLDVIKNKGCKIENFDKLETPYFNFEKVNIEEIYKDNSNNKLHTYTVIEVSGYITSEALNKEESIYIKNNEEYKITGNL